MVREKITPQEIPAWGKDYLETIKTSDPEPGSLKRFLADYKWEENRPDDPYIWCACILALKASSLGNFGVGVVVTAPEGELRAWGHNQVFEPSFNSAKHAEMAAMDLWENKYRNPGDAANYRIYSSLEPCPMCLTRLINSGIGTIIYASGDEEGGMVHKLEDLPQVWVELSSRQVIRTADCSEDLVQAAKRIFEIRLDELYRKLRGRG